MKEALPKALGVIVDSWDGPINYGSNDFSHDEETAVQSALDDCWDDTRKLYDIDQVPELAECCDQILPCVGNDWSDQIVEFIDENPFVSENPFSDFVYEADRKRLNKLIDEWVRSIDWHIYEPNGKFIRLRDKVKEEVANH